MKPQDLVRDEVRRLLKEAALSSKDRSDLYALCGYMEDQDNGDSTYQDFLLMYLSGDRDWKDDHAAIFGISAKRRQKPDSDSVGSAEKSADFDTTKINQIRIDPK